MKKRRIVIITLLALIVIGGFTACRHGHHFGGFDKFDLEAATNRIASRLELDDSQKAEFQVMATEITERFKQMHAERETGHQELADLVRQETITRDTVDRMVTDKFEKMQELADFVAERLIAFHAILTLEQREKIAARIEKHASDRRGCMRF